MQDTGKFNLELRIARRNRAFGFDKSYLIIDLFSHLVHRDGKTKAMESTFQFEKAQNWYTTSKTI